MKYLFSKKIFEDKIDDILDKINDVGFDKLSPSEKNILVSGYSSNNYQYSDNGFNFEKSGVEYNGDNIKIIGIMLFPSNEKSGLVGSKKVFGHIDVSRLTGQTNSYFTDDDYDLVQGMEYEYDEFINMISDDHI